MATDLGESLELAGKAVAITVPLAFVLSVGYDWGYLIALGMSFKGLPSTISDHVRTALIWMPIALMIAPILLELVLRRLNRRIEGGPLGRKQKLPRNPQDANRILNYSLLFAFLGSVVTLAVGGEAPWIMLALSIGVMVFAVLNRLTIRSDHEIRKAVLLFAGIAVGFAAVVAVGMVSASYLSIIQKPIRIQLKGNPYEVMARGVRYFERGVLVSNWPKAESLFIPWERIEEVRTVGSPETDEGLLCNWFDLLCINKRSGSAKNP